jgi:RNA polymerase sigma-70 factor (ECF subfamily)
MSGNVDDFRRLMDRVRDGDAGAAREVEVLYGPAVLHAVRSRLSKQLRSKFDSLDFVQDVWLSFFANPPSGEQFSQPENLVAFLARMACNKVVDTTRQRLGGVQKYDVSRERSLDDSAAGGPARVPAIQPTPSEAVSRGEEWERLLQSQPPVYRRMLILAREGKRPPEIAAELGLHPKMVRRVLVKVLPRLTP